MFIFNSIQKLAGFAPQPFYVQFLSSKKKGAHNFNERALYPCHNIACKAAVALYYILMVYAAIVSNNHRESDAAHYKRTIFSVK